MAAGHLPLGNDRVNAGPAVSMAAKCLNWVFQRMLTPRTEELRIETFPILCTQLVSRHRSHSLSSGRKKNQLKLSGFLNVIRTLSITNCQTCKCLIAEAFTWGGPKVFEMFQKEKVIITTTTTTIIINIETKAKSKSYLLFKHNFLNKIALKRILKYWIFGDCF